MNHPIAKAAEAVGSQVTLARLLSVTPGAVSQWLGGLRPVPFDRCPAIERATDGRVLCEEIRPDVRWQRVPDAAWPHPQGRPCIDVAAPAEPAQPAEQS